MYVPSITVNMLQIFSHLLFLATLCGGNFYQPHFLDVDTEAQGGLDLGQVHKTGKSDYRV